MICLTVWERKKTINAIDEWAESAPELLAS